MERKKYILIIFFLTWGFQSLTASYRQDIYKAYITGDMELWKKVLDRMESQQNSEETFLTELVNFQYGYIGWCIGNKNFRTAGDYLDKAEKIIGILEKSKKHESLVQAYRSAFYGFRIGIHVLKAPFLGPKSVASAKKAVALDQNNPLGHIQFGNCYNYMPAFYGGSKTVALESYRKAEKLMEQEPGQTTGDWNYLNLLSLIGQTYEETGKFKDAKEYYNKILKIEPAFEWVKHGLLPGLTIKMKKDE